MVIYNKKINIICVLFAILIFDIKYSSQKVIEENIKLKSINKDVQLASNLFDDYIFEEFEMKNTLFPNQIQNIKKNDVIFKSNNTNQLLTETSHSGFSIKISLGSDQKEIDLILDIFNFNSYIFSTNMNNNTINSCPSNSYFNSSLSNSYKIDDKIFNSKIIISDMNFTGSQSIDTAIFNFVQNTTKIEQFSFYLVNNAELRYNSKKCFGEFFGGIGLGFSRIPDFSFVEQLKRKGFISNKLVGILFPIQSEKAVLHIGGYEKDYINDTNSINWIDVKFVEKQNIKVDKEPRYFNFDEYIDEDDKLIFSGKNFKYNSYIFQKKIENYRKLRDPSFKKIINEYNKSDDINRFYNDAIYNTLQNSIINWYIETDTIYLKNQKFHEKTKIIMDSLASHITIPKRFFLDNYEIFFSPDVDCRMETDGFFYCKCYPYTNEAFPFFNFEFGKYNFTIKPSDYLQIVINYSDDDVRPCKLLMKLNFENDYWGVGLFVMNNFYLIFDHDQNKIGFYDRNLINQYDSDQALLLILVVSLVSLLLFMIIYYLYRKYIDRSNHNIMVNS